MPDNVSRKQFKKKVLDRWENEGGKILADQTEITETGARDDRTGNDNEGRSIENPTPPEEKESEIGK